MRSQKIEKPTTNEAKPNEPEKHADAEKQVKLIHLMADTLPWITVVLVLISTVLIIGQAILFRK